MTSRENNPDRIGSYTVIALDEVLTGKEESLFLLGVGNAVVKEVEMALTDRNFKNYVNPPKQRRYYDDLHHYPKLEITTKTGCSINCRYCPQETFCRSYLKSGNITTMELDTFKKCIDKMPKEAVITFSGFSEPFLNDDCIPMIEYAASQGRKMELFTTLVGLSVKKLEELMKISDADFISVVLHTPDDKGYANIPMTGEYFEVLDKVLDMIGKTGAPWIDSANCQGIPAPQFIEFAKGRVMVASDLCDRAGNLKEEKGLKKAGKLEGRIKCSRMDELNQWVLLPDGRVVVCCMDFGMRHVLGNLKEQSYEEIKEGAALAVVKGGMACGDNGILCRSCTWAVADQ